MAITVKQRFLEVRKASKLFKTSTYEVSSRCNLTCEGCLFFSGEHAYQHTDADDVESWRDFFRKEAERGVTFAFLAGAEPALEVDRLRAAWEFIPSGMIVTNGTRLIPEEIGFRIHVSLWGSEETSALTRGADVTKKAFRNYSGDPRAIFVYTINSMNLDEMRSMAIKCAEHGVPMTFNYYSPTELYQKELDGMTAIKSDYFRFSSADQNLMLSEDGYRRARETILALKEELPETVIYSMAYDDWVTGESLFELDDDGIAVNCASRSDDMHNTFFVDQERSNLKCSNPTFDCRECRTYASGMTSHVRIEHQATIKSISDKKWSDTYDCWQEIFVGRQMSRLKKLTSKSISTNN